jgi:hypothetical protein
MLKYYRVKYVTLYKAGEDKMKENFGGKFLEGFT